MKRIHRARAAVAAFAAAFALSIAACNADVAPSAPRAPDVLAPTELPSDLLGLDLDLGGTLSGVTQTLSGVLASLSLFPCETPAYGSVTQTIGWGGGVIRVGPHSLHIPTGALTAPVAITATASAGSQVKVDFQPHGLRFQRPAALTLSYSHCSTSPVKPKVVYVDDALTILELVPSVNDTWNRQSTAKLSHFSGYAFAD
ncbi:MAG: hypothetical protein M3303_12920 [Gemmatimonadota bacterium]|nr:hypothetical protein [Gemmatimonadota bacterium]